MNVYKMSSIEAETVNNRLIENILSWNIFFIKCVPICLDVYTLNLCIWLKWFINDYKNHELTILRNLTISGWPRLTKYLKTSINAA